VAPWGLALAVTAALLLIVLVALGVRHRRRGSVERRLRSVSADVLANFLIPDGEGGEIHVEFALLTSHGVLVDVDGHVFGSDTMQDWTVISKNRRFTFSNPQPPLYDRVAAVKRLLPELPVTGYLAFSESAKFSKGRPTNVVMLDQFSDELRRAARNSRTGKIELFQPPWDRLRHEAVTAQFGHLMKG
jgi:hypothetical protein